MRTQIYIFGLICALLLIGCVATVSRHELDAGISEHDTETINSVCYMGSKAGYHYIINQTSLGSKKYRIQDDELHIDDPFLFTQDREKWRILKAHHEIWPTQNMYRK